MNIFNKEDVTGRIQSSLSGFLRAAIVSLLVLAQFGMVFIISNLLRNYSVYLYSLIQILSIIFIVILINDDRSSSYKMSWIFIMLTLPVTGYIMYMLWGNNKAKKKIHRRAQVKIKRGFEYLAFDEDIINEFDKTHPTQSRMTRYLGRCNFPLFKNNKLDYYGMGEDAFQAIFEDIEAAKDFILINFFIIGEGVLWDRMHEVLLKKISQGVKIMFLYDDFGALFRTNKNFKKDLETEGFHVRVFNPIHKYAEKLYMNYRTHQKVIVIDGNIGYTGGMNLADEYVNIIDRFGVWKDNAIRVMGDAVWGLTVTFLQMWEISSEDTRVDYNAYRPTKSFEENDVYCHVIADGPSNNPINPIENIYKQIINYSKDYLYITTPYLIIEEDMRNVLIIAAKSGVDVRIITPNIPDKKSVKILTEYNYGPLLKAGVRIYEYTPGFIHAKTIINEKCGIVGTINMDYRSFYLHYECGVWMCDNEIINTIKADIIETIEQSKEITYQEWLKRPLYIKIYQMILNLFSTQM
ncbi:MAG TPA: cardiolipin synthase [Clostridiales bacterium]|nr:cardiolipin synthase [Clostridiales bacterium]